MADKFHEVSVAEMNVLASGTETDLACRNISEDIAEAKLRLQLQHPFFYDLEYPIP